jgi:hypothetical protein
MDNQNGVFNVLATTFVAYAIANININVVLSIIVGLLGCGLFFLKEYLKSKGYTNFGKQK